MCVLCLPLCARNADIVRENKCHCCFSSITWNPQNKHSTHTRMLVQQHNSIAIRKFFFILICISLASVHFIDDDFTFVSSMQFCSLSVVCFLSIEFRHGKRWPLNVRRHGECEKIDFKWKVEPNATNAIALIVFPPKTTLFSSVASAVELFENCRQNIFHSVFPLTVLFLTFFLVDAATNALFDTAPKTTQYFCDNFIHARSRLSHVIIVQTFSTQRALPHRKTKRVLRPLRDETTTTTTTLN